MPSQIYYAVGLGLYGAAAVVLILSTFYKHCMKDPNKETGTLAKGVRHIFRTYIYLFFTNYTNRTVRVVWFALHVWGTFKSVDAYTFVLNRISVIAFFSSFTLILFYWAERFHKNYYESPTFLPKLGGVFVTINVIVYIAEIVIVTLWILGDESREGNPLYEANIIVDVGLSVCVSVGFLVYGILLFVKTKEVDDTVFADRRKELTQILLITIVFFCCFTCRVVMFLWRPVTHEYLNETVFYIFAYYVPELVPSVLQVYIAESTIEKQVEDEKFIEDLYKNDSTDDLPASESLIRESTSLLSVHNKI